MQVVSLEAAVVSLQLLIVANPCRMILTFSAAILWNNLPLLWVWQEGQGHLSWRRQRVQCWSALVSREHFS